MAMLILLFFPNDHLVWAARLPPEPVHGLLERIRSGQWTFPPAWRRSLERDFNLPPQGAAAPGTAAPMRLRARAMGRLLIVTPWQPLTPKTTPVLAGSLSDLLARLEKEPRPRMQSGERRRGERRRRGEGRRGKPQAAEDTDQPVSGTERAAGSSKME